MIEFECAHADTCLPSYWFGHHLPHVQIVARRGMTLAQVKSAIKDELLQGAVMGSTDNALLLSAGVMVPYSEEYVDQLNDAIIASIESIELTDPENDHCFMDLEESEEDNYCRESVYAFFVFVERDE